MSSMRPAPTNSIGLTATATYDDMTGGTPLLDQLTAQGVPTDAFTIDNIVGMGGAAQVITYMSPKTDAPVTVFVVPCRYDVDRWAEDYYYFADMDTNTAQTTDWIYVYDTVRGLDGS